MHDSLQATRDIRFLGFRLLIKVTASEACLNPNMLLKPEFREISYIYESLDWEDLVSFGFKIMSNNSIWRYNLKYAKRIVVSNLLHYTGNLQVYCTVKPCASCSGCIKCPTSNYGLFKGNLRYMILMSGGPKCPAWPNYDPQTPPPDEGPSSENTLPVYNLLLQVHQISTKSVAH